MKRYFSFVLIFLVLVSCNNYKPQQKIDDNIAYLDRKNAVIYIVTKNTPYYNFGPQQHKPSDGYFARGTKLRLLKASGSYALVESESGIQTYVAMSDLAKLN